MLRLLAYLQWAMMVQDGGDWRMNANSTDCLCAVVWAMMVRDRGDWRMNANSTDCLCAVVWAMMVRDGGDWRMNANNTDCLCAVLWAMLVRDHGDWRMNANNTDCLCIVVWAMMVRERGDWRMNANNTDCLCAVVTVATVQHMQSSGWLSWRNSSGKMTVAMTTWMTVHHPQSCPTHWHYCCAISGFSSLASLLPTTSLTLRLSSVSQAFFAFFCVFIHCFDVLTSHGTWSVKMKNVLHKSKKFSFGSSVLFPPGLGLAVKAVQTLQTNSRVRFSSIGLLCYRFTTVVVNCGQPLSLLFERLWTVQLHQSPWLSLCWTLTRMLNRTNKPLEVNRLVTNSLDNLMKFWHVVFTIYEGTEKQADMMITILRPSTRQTDRQTDVMITILRPSTRQTDRQTDMMITILRPSTRQTDKQTWWSQYFVDLPDRQTNIMITILRPSTRQTDRQTDRHDDHNTLLTYQGKSNQRC